MNPNKRLFAAAAAALVGLSMAPSASARSTVAWNGAANPRTAAGCFAESYGRVINASCASTQIWEMALPVDAEGWWNVTVDVTPTSSPSSASCGAYAVSQDGQAYSLSPRVSATLPSVPQSLEVMEVYVPYGGALYVGCFLQQDAMVNTVNWNPLTCPGPVSSTGACIPCGAVGDVPCTAGCNAGLVEANDYSDDGGATKQVCVSSCGGLHQLPCTNGPMGDQNGEWQGGCTQWDTVIVSSNVCQWPTTCGSNGQGCCDAGDCFQTANATTDLCHDGSTCGYSGSCPTGHWMCQFPPTTGGGSSGGGCTEQDYFFYEVCDGICEGLTQVTDCAGEDAQVLKQVQNGTSCPVYEGSCP